MKPGDAFTCEGGNYIRIVVAVSKATRSRWSKILNIQFIYFFFFSFLDITRSPQDKIYVYIVVE